MQEDDHHIWTQISDILKAEVSEDCFKRWFSTLKLQLVDENNFCLCAPNAIYQFWIESNYASILGAAVERVLGGKRKITFVISSSDNDLDLFQDEEPDIKANGKHVSGNSKAPARKGKTSCSPNLHARYTFDNFVVGAGNQFAHAAASAVSDVPAKRYNPFFLYGGVGLGKTHLMQAIGQRVFSTSNHKARVIYLSSEQFTNEFITAIQNGTLANFRKNYRQADVLLIDDIQFFAGKERSQEEFFHTFNTLFDGQKQIVLSSDRPPSEISHLEHRLVSRFEWGLTAQLEVPDVETRMAILRKKAQHMHIILSDKILSFLAERIRTNVRRLEGALNRVASFTSLSKSEVGLETLEQLLRDILQEEASKVLTIEQIQKRVAEHFDLRIVDITGKRRPANIALPRQVAMFLARQLTKFSLNEIGEAFGGRDHGTVIHACRTVSNKAKKEETFRQLVDYLERQIQQ